MREFSRERERGRVGEAESFRVRGVYLGSKDHGRDRSSFAGDRNKFRQADKSWEKFSVSFFFCNFPASCEASDLWRAFERLGRVVDVYISKKLTRKGSRFGFVRFKMNHDAKKIEEGLNNVWFGSYKLRANLSKYNSKTKQKAPLVTQQVYKEKRSTRSSNDIVDGKLFSDVVANNKKEQFGHKKVNKKNSYPARSETSKPEEVLPPDLLLKGSETDWLSNSLVGELKHTMAKESIGLLMEKENFAVGMIRGIGGNKILIDCLSTENRDKVFGKFEWWSLWFKWVVPWNSDFSTVGRVAKIRCYGVPLQTWCKESFFDIASTCGEVLEIDDDTLDKRNLEYGMVTILTKLWDPISQDVKISVNNSNFSIKVLEAHHVRDFKHDRICSDDSSDDFSSSEDYYSDSEAEDLMKDDNSVFSGNEMKFSDKEVEGSASTVHGSLIRKTDVENTASLERQKSAGNDHTSGKETTLSKGGADAYGIDPNGISVFSGEKACDIGSGAKSRETNADGPLSNKAHSDLGPKMDSFVPDSESSAQNSNQILVNVPGEVMVKLENLSFTVNGIKERGFKSLTEILSNLDSNNLDLSFEKKTGKGKKTKIKQRRSVRAKSKLQVERQPHQEDKFGYERKGISLNSEDERRDLAKLGEELGINLEVSSGKSLAGNHAC